MYAITGATGRLGRFVVTALLRTVPSAEIAALVRVPAKAFDFAANGITILEADYNRPESLGAALSGVDKLLLISGNEIGHRVTQHKAVIDSAKAAGVQLIAYTSVLRADTSPLAIAEEHRLTEEFLKASGVPFVVLRNGWYTENYTASISTALEQGVILGSSGEGRIAAAARADYAAAAAAVLTAKQDQGGRTYELAGDEAFTMAEFAAELSRQSEINVVYRDLPEAEYKTALAGAGLDDTVRTSAVASRDAIATLLARSSAAAGCGALFDDSHQLSRLIGRSTLPLKEAIAAALKA